MVYGLDSDFGLGFELQNSLELGNPWSLPEVLISPELGFAGRFRWILEIPGDRRFRRCRARVRHLRARCCWNLPSSLPCRSSPLACSMMKVTRREEAGREMK
ncbi:hypothetical protein Dimus_002998 [Dionaea muscipula]